MYEIVYENLEENKEFENIIIKTLNKCFEIENISEDLWYVNIVLTNPKYIQLINKEYRGIDKETDVLSFPMYSKEELSKELSSSKLSLGNEYILGDILISIEKVEEQAKEYGHSFERELSYMLVHGFYHLMGYDHMEEDEKLEMRKKEENILEKLKLIR